MSGRLQWMIVRASLGALVGLVLSMSVHAAAPVQQSFASSDDAAAALVAAARSHDAAALRTILGPGSEDLIKSGDRYADEAAQNRFVEWYDRYHALLPLSTERVVLDIGDHWQMPIPIVQRDARWYFDAREGAQEINDRRIGTNEIAAIRVSLAYVDAQNDYFERKKQETGTGEFAKSFASRPGRHDGLYWPAEDGQDASPLEALVAQAKDEGYPGKMAHDKPALYRGYFYRILYSQGAEARDGDRMYVVNGRMTGGFALLAWPAGYGSSGIVSFIVNQDGVVFQKDLGPGTERVAGKIMQFNSDLSWAQVHVTAE
jgi:hypothetical protein